MDPDYAARIERIHHALGIPHAYAARRRLALQREARVGDLQTIALTPERTAIRLVPLAAAAWKDLRAAAAADQVTLLPLSGFRSVARQENIIRQKLTTGQPLSAILRVMAAPGYSEHHTGQALDVGAPGEEPLEECFGETRAFRWLMDHGARFGFTLSYPRDNPHGIAYEPWHWRWLGSASTA